MTNDEKFREMFGIYAEEFWAYPKDKMLDWLQYDVPDTNVGDMISRQAAIKLVDWYQHEFSECDYAFGELANELSKLPSAEQNRIARETAGKSPDEIYDFLHWLMSDYGMQYTDTRAAVIEWLKGERREDG